MYGVTPQLSLPSALVRGSEKGSTLVMYVRYVHVSHSLGMLQCHT